MSVFSESCNAFPLGQRVYGRFWLLGDRDKMKLEISGPLVSQVACPVLRARGAWNGGPRFTVVEMAGSADGKRNATLRAIWKIVDKCPAVEDCLCDMTNSDAIEFPFVERLPKREKSRFRKFMDHFNEMRAITDEKGMLIPVKLAADIAGICKQRIHVLMENGTLERVEFHGHPFITEQSFLAWSKSERKAGRPLRVPETLGAKVKVAREFGRAFAADMKGRSKTVT